MDVHARTHMHTYTHMHMHTCMCTHTHTYTQQWNSKLIYGLANLRERRIFLATAGGQPLVSALLQEFPKHSSCMGGVELGQFKKRSTSGRKRMRLNYRLVYH